MEYDNTCLIQYFKIYRHLNLGYTIYFEDFENIVDFQHGPFLRNPSQN